MTYRRRVRGWLDRLWRRSKGGVSKDIYEKGENE